ncbi:hypothetical protein DFP72DRAFT_1136049 [Ephemerocybe angulata]|uniref:Uncharacterized protein n=1 Tax=Ephemerocybe angulata TaxID=980116 RepID=A0A8H6MCK0_9AGAR|nr:hypothetical protein DFP72DRAFT_1136049 [Tulosesus angulatus]
MSYRPFMKNGAHLASHANLVRLAATYGRLGPSRHLLTKAASSGNFEFRKYSAADVRPLRPYERRESSCHLLERRRPVTYCPDGSSIDFISREVVVGRMTSFTDAYLPSGHWDSSRPIDSKSISPSLDRPSEQAVVSMLEGSSLGPKRLASPSDEPGDPDLPELKGTAHSTVSRDPSDASLPASAIELLDHHRPPSSTPSLPYATACPASPPLFLATKLWVLCLPFSHRLQHPRLLQTAFEHATMKYQSEGGPSTPSSRSLPTARLGVLPLVQPTMIMAATFATASHQRPSTL